MVFCTYQSIPRFAISATLDTVATWSFISHKLAENLPATIQPTLPLTVILPIGKILVVFSSKKVDMLIDDFIYIQYVMFCPLEIHLYWVIIFVYLKGSL